MRIPHWANRLHRSIEEGPVVLDRHRIYVLPTGTGVAYGMALVVMLIASINYNLSLGYGLVFLLTGVGLLSAVHAFRNLIGISIAAGPVEPVFAGDNARFVLIFQNPRPYGRMALCAHTGSEAISFALETHGSREITLPTPARRRGWLQMPRLILQTTYPLGLFRAWSALRPNSRALVYPPAAAPEDLISIGHSDGAQRGTNVDGQDDFAGLRAHRAADSPRHIAWKSVAGGRPLMTKQFHEYADGGLLLDWHTLPTQLNADARASQLAGQILVAEKAGRPYALNLPDQQWPAGHGPAQARRCLKALALVANPEPVYE